jgi:hypothetical protein
MNANCGFLPNLTEGEAGGRASFPTRSPLIYSDAELIKLSRNNAGEQKSGFCLAKTKSRISLSLFLKAGL